MLQVDNRFVTSASSSMSDCFFSTAFKSLFWLVVLKSIASIILKLIFDLRELDVSTCFKNAWLTCRHYLRLPSPFRFREGLTRITFTVHLGKPWSGGKAHKPLVRQLSPSSRSRSSLPKYLTTFDQSSFFSMISPMRQRCCAVSSAFGFILRYASINEMALLCSPIP